MSPDTTLAELGYDDEEFADYTLDDAIKSLRRYIRGRKRQSKKREIYSWGMTVAEVAEQPMMNLDNNDLPGEVWYEVTAYPHYHVSNIGRVRSLERRAAPSDRFPKGRLVYERILKPMTYPGYNESPVVHLSRRDENGTPTHFTKGVIHLVAEYVCKRPYDVKYKLARVKNRNVFDLRCENILVIDRVMPLGKGD